MLNNGFYTALGTPLTKEGEIIESALRLHIDQQIEAGAKGLLLMGSMGIQCAVRHSEYAKAVSIALDAVAGRVPLFVGAMDNSLARVKDRLDMIGRGLPIAGIVLTTPFYSPTIEADAINFFTRAAEISPYPIYIYDLPGVTQFKITLNVIDALINNNNIGGMKSPDWELIKKIERKYPDAQFECLYSGLDSFDYASALGIKKNLDGMFACTPKNGKTMYEAIERGDYKTARACLDNILLLRDRMVANGLFPCFTVCMNLLGVEGEFGYDYNVAVGDKEKAIMLATMEEIGEL